VGPCTSTGMSTSSLPLVLLALDLTLFRLVHASVGGQRTSWAPCDVPIVGAAVLGRAAGDEGRAHVAIFSYLIHGRQTVCVRKCSYQGVHFGGRSVTRQQQKVKHLASGQPPLTLRLVFTCVTKIGWWSKSDSEVKLSWTYDVECLVKQTWDYVVPMLEKVGQQLHAKSIGDPVSNDMPAACLAALCLGHAF